MIKNLSFFPGKLRQNPPEWLLNSDSCCTYVATQLIGMLWTSRGRIADEKMTMNKVSRWHFVAVNFKRDRLVCCFDMQRKHKGSCLPCRKLPGISTGDMRVSGTCHDPLWLLTYWEEAPRDRRSGETAEDVVRVAEVREVGAGHRLASALAPHEDLPALGLGSRCVAGVARGNLHHPRD